MAKHQKRQKPRIESQKLKAKSQKPKQHKPRSSRKIRRTYRIKTGKQVNSAARRK